MTRRGLGPVVAVVIAGLATTVVGMFLAADTLDNTRAQRFRLAAEQTREQLATRVEVDTATLLALRNDVMTAWPIQGQWWNPHVELDAADGLHESLQAVEFVRAVPTADTDAYERRVRADDPYAAYDLPPFGVTPATTDQDVRFVVELVTPVVGNEAAIGLDLASDVQRRAALVAARDRGAVVASRPIRLVQETGDQRAVLLAAAVYDDAEVPATAPARRRHHVGFVRYLVRIGELLEGALGPGDSVRIELYDVGETVAAPAARYDDAARLYPTTGPVLVAADGTVTGTHELLDLDIGGRRWRLVMAPGEDFPTEAPWLVAAVGGLGLIATLLLGGIIATVASARARAEAKVAIRTSELRTMIARAPDATIVVAPDGRILLASDMTEHLLGWAPDALTGRPIEDLIPAPLRGRHVGLRTEYVDGTPVAREMGSDFEVQALHRDGRVLEVEVSLNPLPSAPGRAAGNVIASLRDVTTRREARRALQRASEQKTAFLRTVSHELRTPLTAIAGFTDVLLHHTDRISRDEQAEFLRRIERNTVGLQRLIEEILDFSRLEQGQLQLRPEPTDLGALTGDVVAQLAPTLTSHTVEVRVPDEPVVAIADREAVTRVLTNLLTNAVRYSPDGTRVVVRVGCDAEHATLVVDDEGPGIPAQERARVFERFWRGNHRHVIEQSGTGIGLAVVAELTERQGGTAAVADAPGGGARLIVSLPLA